MQGSSQGSSLEEAGWMDGEEPDREEASRAWLYMVVVEKGTSLAVRRSELLPQPAHQAAVYSWASSPSHKAESRP